MLAAMGVEGVRRARRRELAATGETVPQARGRRARANSPPRRAQIAWRARDGRTNSEIAAELFLSPRTVEWHLRKVFTKLGISSRQQLRAALPTPAGRALPT